MRIAFAALLLAFSASIVAQESNPAAHEPSAWRAGEDGRVIVKFRNRAAAARIEGSGASDAARALAARARVALRAGRTLPAGLEALALDPASSGEPFAAQLERLRADPEVEFVERDERRFVHALPNDPLFSGQWYLTARADAPSAIDAEAAWDSSVGSRGVVIAIVDTGVLLDHPDLGRAAAGGRVLPGYDFISDTATANDGDGRDRNPTDSGDWVTQAESTSGPFAGCDVRDSSWHGTRVAGILGAHTNNAQGVAGVTWDPWILPVRALGKCGGRDSDILDALAWAAGLSVPGVPDNPYPAKVANLSLGSSGPCIQSYRAVIDALAARGVLVVVSAGNEGGPVSSPANCPGVASVAALRHAGTKVGFSNLGLEVTIGAPGGNCVNIQAGLPCLFSIDTTSNTGTTSPATHTYTNQTNVNVGTSFSAPIVSGIAGLMAAANGNLGAAQLIARLREGATTPFPVSADPTVPTCHVPLTPSDLQVLECNCTTDTCGAGMASAVGALAAAERPIAALAVPSSVAAGALLTLSGAGSAAACGRTLADYSWTVLGGPGAVSSTTGPTTTVFAPATGTLVVRLTVTDDAARTDSALVTITATSAATTAPASAGASACLAAVAAPPPVSVAVAPASAQVATLATRSFAATVANASDTRVTWQVDGVTGGNATLGTISPSGLYTAPAVVPTTATVTVTARSNEDATATGTATVTIAAAPPVTPSGGGGGGGQVGWLGLIALLGAAVRRRIGPQP
jgi:serine protease